MRYINDNKINFFPDDIALVSLEAQHYASKIIKNMIFI